MDEARCLERLVEQRSQRISYTRLLSWEMDPKMLANPGRKNRQLASAKVQNEFSLCKVHNISSESDMTLQSIETKIKESDSDTYYSADENQLQDCSCSESDECYDAFEDFGDVNCFDIKECEFDECLSKENEELSDKDMDEHCSTNSEEFNSYQNVHSSQQKRAPSKKQKRKKRGKSKMMWDYVNQLPYIDDNIDLNEIKEHINERDVSIRKTIPSLAKLCLMSSKGLVSDSNTLCNAFRKLYCDSFAESTFHKDQLKWLFYLLSCLEHEEGKTANTSNCEPTSNWVHHIDKDGLGNKKVFLRSCRNIWSPALYMKQYSNRLLQSLDDTYSHVALSACLPNNFLMSLVTSDQDYVNNYLCSFLGLSVFAATIDSMLPASYLEPARYSTQKGRVKHVLQKRFPVGTKVCFDVALPYVYWSRGELKLATDHFLALVQTESRGRFKALYMNELARMYAQIGEGDLAARFYRMASDAAQEKSRNFITGNQISGQSMIILSEVKARRSRGYWQSVLSSSEYHKEGSERAAIEAMLCFHGYWWTDDKSSWLQVAADWLKELVKSNPDLHYHLACVYGFMGNFDEADAFMKMSNFRLPYCRTISVDIKLSIVRREWGFLTSCDQRTIPHMRVMWRTQLCHPLYNGLSKNGMESDFCNRDLHLRLNREGCITGDMQMCLPPIRAVCLNPYTGFVTFNSIPGRTESWKCHDEAYSENFKYLFYIATPYELYSDEDGITVHLKHPRSEHFVIKYRGYSKKLDPTHSMVLNWRNNEGLTEKINLLGKIQDYLYKETMNEILQKDYSDMENPEKFKKDALQFLDFAYKNGQFITMQVCMLAAGHLKGYEGKLAKTKEKYYQTILSFKPKLKIQGQPVIYGKCLMFLINYKSLWTDKLRVIIKCGDRESFKSPKIQWFKSTDTVKICEAKPYITLGAKLAWSIEHGKSSNIILFDQNGEIHEKIPYEEVLKRKIKKKIKSFCIMGENFVFIDNNGRMCIRQEHKNIPIANFTGVKKIHVVNADVCIIHESLGICLYNVRTRECLKLNVKIEDSIERYGII
ncbi:unnamed protein product [Mytilus coruscus]|uniref:Uncharacterized protein n=1 Tax=Mytilus coruscus TaxID=42192 RepID=A0A6J8ALE0_MYTCO|nr:unnamed protein product [Mytilus coruscus]